VTNFSIGGRSGDPSQIPGVPPDFAQHFGQGTGGVVTRDSVPADPACAERAKKDPAAIYASGAAGGAARPQRPPACVTGGPVTSRRLGPVSLGETEAQIRGRLGAPDDVLRGTLRWCAARGGRYVVAERGDRSGDLGSDDGAPAVLLLTTDPGFGTRGVRAGSRASALRRAFPRSRSLTRVGRTRLVALRPPAGLVAGVRGGRVRFLAVYDRSALRTAAAVRRTGFRSLAG
jgi:hypothetical protein